MCIYYSEKAEPLTTEIYKEYNGNKTQIYFHAT